MSASHLKATGQTVCSTSGLGLGRVKTLFQEVDERPGSVSLRLRSQLTAALGPTMFMTRVRLAAAHRAAVVSVRIQHSGATFECADL